MQSTIVSADWLHEHLDDANLVILDASTKTNVSGKDSQYDGKYIPKARFIDLKRNFSDLEAPFPNTLQSESQFELEARKLGIHKNSQIVVYDNLGVYNSPRIWWMFQAMGHKSIAVLDGGLPAWAQQGYKLTEDFHTAKNLGDFEAKLNKSTVKSYSQVLENIDAKDFSVIDARSRGRFDGSAPEPRQGLSSGHLPNSCSLPFEMVLDQGHFKSTEELTTIFSNLKTGNSPLVFSCGSGLTACIILLAAELVIENEKAVFDGSWTEWASTEGAPIEKNA